MLIIDDDPDDQELLKHILERLNMANDIVILKNGEEAYNYLAETDTIPFLIFSDINMPKMNGIELRVKMQQEGRAEMLTVPFIFLTTGDIHDPKLKASKTFSNDIYNKPRNLPDYRELVKKIVDHWKDIPDDPFFA